MQLTRMALVPFTRGQYKALYLYRDFNNAKHVSVVRVAVHSASKGYGPVRHVTLDTNSPVSIPLGVTDANGVSLVLESGNSPVGYALA